MKILVAGASGQLGYDVCRVLETRGIEHVATDSAKLDIRDAAAVSAWIASYRPDAVIHCAAYTKVDRAEDESALCFAVNEDGARNVACACKECGAKMLYVSTDYVFSGAGEQFYEVDEPAAPKNVYGRSKLAGELAVKETLERYFIVRTSWLFGINGGNFVKTILRLSESRVEINVVCDQIGSPTYSADLARLLCDMIVTEKYGTYHATNEGTCSWRELADEIVRLAGRNMSIHPVLSSQYPTRALRPLNSRLSKRSLDGAGFHRLPNWRDALARYISKLS